MPSDKTNLMIVLTIIGLAISYWGVVHLYSSELVYTVFEPPEEVGYTSGSHFSFKLHNYGEKSGNYYLKVSSNDLLVKIGNSVDNDYSNEAVTWNHLEDEQDHNYLVYFKANETNMPENATVNFMFVDKSPLFFDKKIIMDFDYELNTEERYDKYVSIGKSGKIYRFFNFGNIEIRTGKITLIN